MLGKSPYCVFSFGGGVQSSAIYLMLMHEPGRLLEAMGELPDKVYFADTGAETKATYKCLEHMQKTCSGSFQIETVNNGNILESAFADSGLYKACYPFFIKNGITGKVGMAQRMCTSNYKIRAIQKATRQAFNLKGMPLRDNFISMWLGISIDEIDRARDSRDKWIVNRYPLIELGLTRQDCLDYCARYDWIPTKSRCYFCPYQSDANWLELKQTSPDEFDAACKEDERVRSRFLHDGSKAYLHQSCVPLRDVVFKGENNNDGFGNDCQGICGI